MMESCTENRAAFLMPGVRGNVRENRVFQSIMKLTFLRNDYGGYR